jgi:uncharacterized protein (TIGR02246 family)
MVTKLIAFGLLGFALGATGQARNQGAEAAARKPVEAFYSAFDQGFTGPADFAAEDWAHINPNGGWTRGRENVLKEVRDVHSTFLKGVTDTIEQIEVRLASQDAAVVTVISRTSTYATPDGVKHENQRHIRTFAVVKRGGRWLVMQDQSTTIARLD